MDSNADNETPKPLGVASTEGLGAWVRCSERMPIPAESPSGYFWCWDEKRPEEPPEILEVYGYKDYHETPCTGFCHEASGVVAGVTHWQPAMPPQAPNVGGNATAKAATGAATTHEATRLGGSR